MPRIPEYVKPLLDDFAARSPAILGRNFTGIYVYGSLTQGALSGKAGGLPRRADKADDRVCGSGNSVDS
ncbi:MAG: hypothetical protein HRF49_07795 [bacterium]